MTLVIDTSVTMSWCFEDEASTEADEVLDRVVDEGAVAPYLWQLEVANVLALAERRGRLTEAQSTRFVTLLDQLPIVTSWEPSDLRATLDTARRHALTAYDAAYLMVAAARDLPLATFDDELASAARDAGVPLVIDRP